MKNLSEFIKDEFIKKALFTEGLFVDSIDGAKKLASEIGYGDYKNIVFKNTSIKEYFIDNILTIRPDTTIINCNCSISKFNDLNINNLSGLIIFNNVNKCKHTEIIEAIKNIKGIMIC